MSLTTEERFLLEGLVRRAEAVRRYAELCLRQPSGFVPTVGAFGAWTLIRTLFLLYGEHLRRNAFEWIFARLQDDAGLCNLCGKLKALPEDIACRECLDEFDRMDRQDDIDVAMEKPPRGRPA